MATRRKAAPPVEEELEELEELDEVLDEVESEAEPDETTSLTAKEAALKLKVDARTFRKFLRSKYGKVGQGNRWLIEADEFDALRTEFDAWHKPKPTEPKPDPTPAPAVDEEPDDLDDLFEESDELEDLDELEEV